MKNRTNTIIDIINIPRFGMVILLALTCVWFAPTTVLAQEEIDADQSNQSSEEDILEEVVVVGVRNFLRDSNISSTKLNQALAETAKSITVIDEVIFDSLGLGNFLEAIDLVPGANYGGSFGRFGTITARGYEEENVKVDGIRVGDNLMDNIAVGSMEFVKGGSATVFGEGGPGGFINLISKSTTVEPEIFTSLELGSWSHARLEARASGAMTESKNTRGLISAAYEQADTWAKGQENEKYAFYGKLDSDLSDNVYIEFTAYYMEIELTEYNDGWSGIINYDAEGNIVGSEFPDLLPWNTNTGQPWSTEEDEDWWVHGKLDWKLSDHMMLSFIGAITQGNFTQTLFDVCCEINEDTYMTDGFFYYSNRTEDYLYGEVRLNGDFDWGNTHNTYLVTAEYRDDDWKQNYSDYLWLTPVDMLDIPKDIPFPYPGMTGPEWTVSAERPTQKIKSLSATILSEYDKWIFQLGARYDDFVPTNTGYSDYFETVTGYSEFPNDNTSLRASAMYEIIENGRIYYSYNETFEQNTHWTCDEGVLGPETGEIHEIGYKQELYQGKLLFTTAVWDIKTEGNPRQMSQEDCPSQGGTPTYEAGDGSSSTGFEAELVGGINDNMNIIAGFAYVDASYVDDSGVDVRNPNVPKWSGSIYMTYDFLEGPAQGLGFSVGVNYKGERLAWAAPGDVGTEFLLDSMTKVNAAAYYIVNDHLNFSLHVKNLLDSQDPFSPFGTIYYQNQWQEPRNFLLTANYLF